MKSIILTFTFIFSFVFSFSQNKNTQNITVTISNIKSDKGKAILTLHNENTFMVTEGIQNIESNIENGKIIVTFKNVSPGTYAIMAMHDENDNKKMDFSTNRMPLEDYGMSNNPINYGPPQFNDAKFKVENKDLEMRITF
ncbi:MAG: DUF2141 domain-containing protein [Lacinutrix venerupis]